MQSVDHPRVLVPAIARAFAVLERLDEIGEFRGVTDLSRDLGLPKSTTFNVVHTLEQLGYLHKSADSDRYGLGYKAFTLGSSVAQRPDLHTLLRPLLEELVRETGESANLGTIRDGHAIYNESLQGPGPVTVIVDAGQRLPLHSTALGKALIAWLPEAEVSELLPEGEFARSTPNTITTRDRLTSDLGTVRARGYSIDDQEDHLEIRCIGAPVWSRPGIVAAAISLTAPCQRLHSSRVPDIAEVVCKYAARMSERLGYRPDTVPTSTSTST